MKKKAVILQSHMTLAVGSTILLLERCKYMVGLGWDVTIVSLQSKDELIAGAREAGVSFVDVGGPVSSSPWFWLFFPYHYWRVQQRVRQINPDYLISGAFPAIWWGWLYKMLNPRAFHVFYCFEPSAFIYNMDWARSIKPDYMRWGLFAFNPLLRWIEKVLHPYTDYTVAISRFTLDQISTVYPRLDPHKTKLVYCGIDHAAYFPEPATERRPQILIIGVLAKFKHVDWLLSAVHRLKTRYPHEQVQVVIKGKGPEKESLMAMAQELNIAQSVQLIERFYTTDELRHLISSSRVLVHAAHNEAFGLTAVEAMACGTPAVVTGSGGTGETVVDGVSGLYFRPGDIDDLAAQLHSLLADDTRWEALSAGAIERANLFRWDETTRLLCDLLNEALPSSGSRNIPENQIADGTDQ